MDLRDSVSGVGVDTGARWCAAVGVVDGVPVDGFTMGPQDEHGLPDRLANQDLDPIAIDRFCERFLTDFLAPLVEKVERLSSGPLLIAVEKVTPPRSSPTRARNIPVVNWLVPWTVMQRVLGTYRDALLVPTGNNGVRHQIARGGNGKLHAAYPAELGRKRPAGWGPNEHHRRARDHERAGYDVLVKSAQLLDRRRAARAA